MKKKTNRTFTLIEMLIVIVIIGILAAALVPRLTSIQSRARDSKRKIDLKAIYNANEIHKLDYGYYAASGSYVQSSAAQPRMSWLTGYLSSLPVDPINDYISASPLATGTYLYTYISLYGEGYYSLSAMLENTKDPERCWVKTYVYSSNLIPRCWAGHLGTSQLYYYDPPNMLAGKH